MSLSSCTRCRCSNADRQNYANCKDAPFARAYHNQSPALQYSEVTPSQCCQPGLRGVAGFGLLPAVCLAACGLIAAGALAAASPLLNAGWLLPAAALVLLTAEGEVWALTDGCPICGAALPAAAGAATDTGGLTLPPARLGTLSFATCGFDDLSLPATS